MWKKTLAAAAAWFVAVGVALSAPPMKALIIDGRNNHDWKATTPVLKQHLESTGLYTVEVATAPPRGEDISGFLPEFADYDVIVSNYNDGELWSPEARDALVSYVHGGGGLVIVHAANNAFTSWKEFNDMIGLGWRGADFGRRLTLNDAGKVVITPPGDGPGAGHGPQHAYPVVIRDREHPVTQALPGAWMHARDELYHGQRGPAADMHVLATAYSGTDKGGTGAHEPMMWVIPYGEGRVFTTVLGHSTGAMQCVGFITTFLRGAEWAATGKVTQTDVPDDFPTLDEVSVRE